MSIEERHAQNITEAGESTASGSLNEVHRTTEDMLRQAIADEDRILIHAEPSTGKTTSLFTIASEVDAPITYLTKREDLYDQAKGLAEKYDLNTFVLPSPHRNCPIFNPDTPAFNQEAQDFYGLGIDATRIHNKLDLHDESSCEFMQKNEDFDPDDHDVIIGHYKHAYRPSIVEDRIVVVDEFPGSAFEQTFDDLPTTITKFCKHTEIPYDDYTDLIEHRDESNDKHWEAYDWFSEHDGIGPDPETVLEADANERYHTLAPFLTYTLLNSQDVGNGFEIPSFNLAAETHHNVPANLDRNRRTVWNRETGTMHLLTPPDLRNARGVIGLDGTPTIDLWRIALGGYLDYRPLFEDNNERNRYFRETLGLTIKPTSEHLKPYNSSSDKRFSFNRDMGLLYTAEARHGQQPDLITTKKALKKYDERDITKHASRSKNYGEVLSSNDFKGSSLGVIQGAPHPGDDLLKRWAGYFGHPIEGEGDGMGRRYGDFGDKIYQHFVHNQVMQAICRFGRGKSAATVYVNTRALPFWFDDGPTHNPEAFDTHTKRVIAEYLRWAGDEGGTKTDLTETIEISKRQVERILSDFTDIGYVEVEDQPGPYPNIYQWADEESYRSLEHVNDCQATTDPHIEHMGFCRPLPIVHKDSTPSVDKQAIYEEHLQSESDQHESDDESDESENNINSWTGEPMEGESDGDDDEPDETDESIPSEVRSEELRLEVENCPTIEAVRAKVESYR
jgi:hypothetical protein